MSLLGEPAPQPEGRRGAWLLGAGIALLALGIGAFLLWRRPSPERAPRPRPSAPVVRRSTAPPTARPSGLPATPRPGGAGPPRPAADEAAPVLVVDADVPGATVFLDRTYLGKTPLRTREVPSGRHRLDVSAEGHDIHSEEVDLDGPREVMVRFREVRLDASVEVVHKHGVGSCRGRLVATPRGLRYESSKRDHAFDVPLSEVERLEVDYLKRNLALRVGRKTFNFGPASGDAASLLAFQQQVEKARGR